MQPGITKNKIRIHITTYKRVESDLEEEMNEKGHGKCFQSHHNKYICAICLNNTKVEDKNIECSKNASKCCPICQKNKDYCGNTNKKEKDKVVAEKEIPVTEEPKVKIVQTSDDNVAQGLSLLNEVLTVFQNKKVDISKEKAKSGLFKDAAVSTEEKNDKKNLKDRSRLTVSTFQYSIDDTKKNQNGKFTIVNCCQPDFVRAQNSIDLIKHKSSSIPQMKLEELKYSLKEKSRSKDAIEEVNRMFATVRQPGCKYEDNSNRPMIRNGPRVLPVVKNNTYQENKNDFGTLCEHQYSCKCCQTCMSSGDSVMRPNECCHNEREKCDKCVYMMCCNYKNKRKMQAGVLLCEHCRSMNDEHFCQHESYVDDSS